MWPDGYSRAEQDYVLFYALRIVFFGAGRCLGSIVLYKAPSPTEFFFAQFLVLEILGNLSVEIFSAFFLVVWLQNFLRLTLGPYLHFTDGQTELGQILMLPYGVGLNNSKQLFLINDNFLK